MKLYLSGPISGIPDFAERFSAAEAELTEMGHTAINPAVLPLGLSPADYMRVSLAQLEAAEAVVLLPGWALSGGAQIEALSALYAGKKLFAYMWDAAEQVGFLKPMEGELAKTAISLSLGGLTEKRPTINDEQAKLFHQRPFVLPSRAEGGTRGGQWPPLQELGGMGDPSPTENGGAQCAPLQDGPADYCGMVPMDFGDGFLDCTRKDRPGEEARDE